MAVPQLKHSISRVPIKVIPMHKDEVLSIATGFFYEKDSQSFFITNYHVVSGINPNNNKILDTHGRVPDSIVLAVQYREKNNEDNNLVNWHGRKIKLYSGSDYSRPIWTNHPDFGKKFDVVAIPFSGLDTTNLHTANFDGHPLYNISLYPSIDVFIPGYPRGMSGAGFPIWKRATLATEPELDIDGLPKMYVDTATREGMSGSPVYAQEKGYWMPEHETKKENAMLGRGLCFIGVYSGRLGAEDEFKAQIGIVWKKSAVVKMLDSVSNEHLVNVKDAELYNFED